MRLPFPFSKNRNRERIVRSRRKERGGGERLEIAMVQDNKGNQSI